MTATESHMANRPRTARENREPAVVLDRDVRRQAVARLTQAHLSQREIAERLGVSQPTVHRDQQVVRRYWRAKAVAHYDDVIAEELAKYNQWEQAILMRPFVVFDDDGDPRIVPIAAGEVRPLDNADVKQLLEISAARRKLLGLDMPARSEVAVTIDEDLEAKRERAKALVIEQFERVRAIRKQDAAIEDAEVVDG